MYKMGQQEVYDFLRKSKGKWFTSKEIASGLRASVGSVTTCLKKLRDGSDLEFEYRKGAQSRRKNAYIYKFRR